MDFQQLLSTAGRVALVYIYVLIIIRWLGKREVGNVTAFDLLAAFMIGETVDEVMFANVTLVQGFVAIAVIACMHRFNSWASSKSRRIDRLTGAAPTTLIEHGRILDRALASERMNKEELESQLRLLGIEDPKEIKLAILEPSGHVSVIKEEWAKEAQKSDLERMLRKQAS